MKNRASGKNAVDVSGKITDISAMTGIDSLLRVARRYAEIEGVPLSTVSWRAFNDGKKLSALESGADINVKRMERALRWFSENWPSGEWPDDIARPPSAEVRA
jgi:hypothetical protein